MRLEECFTPNDSDKKNLYEWFISQDHIPFDMSSDAHGMYYTMYQEFLKDLLKLYNEKHDKYYWFTNKGRLVSDEGRQIINGNCIRVNKIKMREFKLNLILEN